MRSLQRLSSYPTKSDRCCGILQWIILDVGRVIGAALHAPGAPKLPAPSDAKELILTLQGYLQQLQGPGDPADQSSEHAMCIQFGELQKQWDDSGTVMAISL